MVRDADGGRVFSAARSEASEGFVCLISPGRPVERRPGQVRAAAPPSVAAAGTSGMDSGGDKRSDLLSPQVRKQPLLRSRSSRAARMRERHLLFLALVRSDPSSLRRQESEIAGRNRAVSRLSWQQRRFDCTVAREHLISSPEKGNK